MDLGHRHIFVKKSAFPLWATVGHTVLVLLFGVTAVALPLWMLVEDTFSDYPEDIIIICLISWYLSVFSMSFVAFPWLIPNSFFHAEFLSGESLKITSFSHVFYNLSLFFLGLSSVLLWIISSAISRRNPIFLLIVGLILMGISLGRIGGMIKKTGGLKSCLQIDNRGILFIGYWEETIPLEEIQGIYFKKWPAPIIEVRGKGERKSLVTGRTKDQHNLTLPVSVVGRLDVTVLERLIQELRVISSSSNYENYSM